MALYFLFREIYNSYYERQLAQLGERHYFENEDLVRVIGSSPVLFLLRFYIREFNKSYYERSDLYEDIY